MKLNIIKEDEEGFEMEIEGEGHTLCNLLVASLNKNDDVEFAAYRIEHPLIGTPKIFLKLKNTEKKKDTEATSIEELKGVGKKKAEKLERAGIKFAEDLLNKDIAEVAEKSDIDAASLEDLFKEAKKIAKKDRFGYKKLIKRSLKELIETIEETEKKFKKAV